MNTAIRHVHLTIILCANYYIDLSLKVSKKHIKTKNVKFTNDAWKWGEDKRTHAIQACIDTPVPVNNTVLLLCIAIYGIWELD